MFGNIKKALTLNKALDQYGEISKEIDSMDSKNLLLSKTFWLNVAGLAVTLGGILPQKWAGPVLVGSNIIMRLVSSQPVTLFPSGFFK